MASRARRKYFEFRNRLGSFYSLILGSVIFFVIFLGGTFGYMYLEQWSFFDGFYMTILTLSTVGYQEVHQLSQMGRLFTSALIFAGVGTFMFLAGSIGQLLVEGKLQQLLGRRRMQSMVNKLEDHYIVCGFGRIGSVVAREIHAEGYPVVVIENDPMVLEKLEAEGLYHVSGDATSDEVLLNAGLGKAKSLIAALTNEAANVYVILTARQLNPDILIISRCDTDGHTHRLELAGADRVIMPNKIGGVRMAQSVLRPTAISFLELAMRGGIDLQLEELFVSHASELVNKDLIASKIRPRFNLIIVGIKKASGELVFNPAPQAIIEGGDTLLAIGNKDNLSELLAIL